MSKKAPKLERIIVIEFRNTRMGVTTIVHSAWQTRKS